MKSVPKDRSIIDVFTGTTRVAQALKQMGRKVITSDLSQASEAYSYAFIANNNNQHLQPIIDELNSIEPRDGWLTQNYCDVDNKVDDDKVRYWQPKNGSKADAIRDKIDELDLEHWEKMTLITSLIFALDKVDNTVGVQQAFLKDWCKRSYNDLKLVLPPMTPGPKGQHFSGNALDIEYPIAFMAYLDPPYSPHSYATYYHIWDSIVLWDKPKVALKTNRRIDRVGDSSKSPMSSQWNRKSQVVDAFKKLVDRLPVRYILLSYSNESLISYDEIYNICKQWDNVPTIKEIDYKRNIMSQIGNATMYKNAGFKTRNKELLFLIRK